MREVEKSHRNIKAQKDSLKAEFEQLGVGVISDSGVESSNKKRQRQELGDPVLPSSVA